MRIVLYTCTAETNRVDKEDYITNAFQLEGTLRSETSALDPVIKIEKTNPLAYNYNYMFIKDFHRFYFITNIIHIRNNLWEIHAHVDVLYSWMTDIKKSRAVIDRTSSFDLANLYLDDGSFVMDSHKYNTVKSFSNGFNNNSSNILICAGGT